MKIAFVSTMTGYPWGGSEELWSQTALKLKGDGHEVQASVANHAEPSEKVLNLAKQGISVGTYPYRPQGIVNRVITKLARKRERAYSRLKQFNPDLAVVSQGHNSGGFDWAKVCRDASIPYVIIVQSNSEHMWFCDDEVEEAASLYRDARKVYCVSQGNLDLLRIQLGDPVKNGEVIWNPYNVSPHNIPAWPANDGKWKLACVARMEPQAKGQELLLQVLARPEWRERPLELNFFGKGPHEFTLKRLANMLGVENKVNFCGHVSNIEKVWEQNHMLVLPSRYEGLPLALVESMWCGRPALVTAVAGNTEVCIDNETGFVAPAPTVPLLAETMERAWKRREDWQRMGEAARARAERQIPRDPIGLFAEQLVGCSSLAEGAAMEAVAN